jgi:hypothetical protein
MALYNIMPLQKEERNTLERQLADNKQTLGRVNSELERLGNLLATIPDSRKISVPVFHNSAAQVFLETGLNRIGGIRSIVRDRQNTNQRNKSDLTTALRNIQAKLKESNSGAIVWDSEVLEAELRKTSQHYIHDSLHISEDGSVATWRLAGIKMCPDHNQYINVEIPEGGIPLDAIIIKYYPRTGKVYVQRIEAENWNDGWGGQNGRPHPHIMSDSTPCLGNFAATKFQCTEVADLVSLNLVMSLFLQSANTKDSAGRYWPTYITKRYNPNSTELYAEADVLEAIVVPFYAAEGLSDALMLVTQMPTLEIITEHISTRIKERTDELAELHPKKTLGQDYEDSRIQNMEKLLKLIEIRREQNQRIIITAKIRNFSQYNETQSKCIFGVNL